MANTIRRVRAGAKHVVKLLATFCFRSYKLRFETSERLLMLFTLNAGENLQTQMCVLKQLKLSREDVFIEHSHGLLEFVV